MAYEIISIIPRVEVTPTGELVHIYQIDFLTERGAHGVVRVPQERFDADLVKELIAERAKQLDSLYEV